jgi:hypothetical protein
MGPSGGSWVELPAPESVISVTSAPILGQSGAYLI